MNAIARPMPPRPITWLGLALAMFGTPLFLYLARLDVGDADGLGPYLFREAVIFLMLAALLLIVRKGERLPFSSIGWHTDRLGNAALWSLLGLLLSAVALAIGVGVAYLMHWKLGLQEAPKYEPPVWAMAITVLRAGVTEEVFYRGYALERLMSITGSKWAAVVLTLVPFALFHFRQGPAGILIAGLAALALTGIYLKRRSLPAVILTHFTVDFIPNVLLPLLGVG
jgi:membrane protease YdiL (CAAX protease family)